MAPNLKRLLRQLRSMPYKAAQTLAELRLVVNMAFFSFAGACLIFVSSANPPAMLHCVPPS